MDDTLKIYTERLREGKRERIAERVGPELLDVHEEELAFSEEIELSGEAYLADSSLVMHLSAETRCQIPCLICNEQVSVAIKMDNAYHIEPLENIGTGIFDFSAVLREGLLLETPLFAECNDGHCPERAEIEKFLKKPSDGDADDESYHPFADLN